MEGKILDYNNEFKSGLIRGADDIKYRFSIDECKSTFSPRIGSEVDFVPNGDKATDIYVLMSDPVNEIKNRVDQTTHTIANTILEKNNDLSKPEGVEGGSMGAFMLAPIWAIANKTWIGLLFFIPYIGIVIPFILAIYGREWAWKNNNWDSYEHFDRVQKKWSKAGWIVLIILLTIMFGSLAIVSYEKGSMAGIFSEEAKTEIISSDYNNKYQESVPAPAGMPALENPCAVGYPRMSADGASFECVEQ